MVLQLFAILGFGLIAYQDIKERMVQWLLFPLVGLLIGLHHWFKSDPSTFLVLCLSNVVLVSVILVILWLYTKFINKRRFLNTSFGLGDVLFLYAFALGFPPITFLVLLTSGIFFSFLIHIILAKSSVHASIPLAGYLSLFLIGMLIISFFGDSLNLYVI